MPINGNGVVKYAATFNVLFNDGSTQTCGFDINWSGYGETAPINQTIRVVPWSSPGGGATYPYILVIQNAGLNPITREYQVTVYHESDYFSLRNAVGMPGQLVTPREGSPNPSQPQPAQLVSVKRGNFQYPGWPLNIAASPNDPSSVTTSNIDLQTLVLDFIMLSSGGSQTTSYL